MKFVYTERKQLIVGLFNSKVYAKTVFHVRLYFTRSCFTVSDK